MLLLTKRMRQIQWSLRQGEKEGYQAEQQLATSDEVSQIDAGFGRTCLHSAGHPSRMQREYAKIKFQQESLEVSRCEPVDVDDATLRCKP